MTDDTKRNLTKGDDPLHRTGSSTDSNSITSFDAFGSKGGGQVSLSSFQTAAGTRTPDRGFVFGAIKGGERATSGIFTDSIVMLSKPVDTVSGLSTMITNFPQVVGEGYSSVRNTISSGNSENIGSMFGSAAVNTAFVATAARGMFGAKAGMAESSAFSGATKFEGQVAARTDMLRSAETGVVKTTAINPAQLADDALRLRASEGALTAHPTGATLVDDFMHARPSAVHPEFGAPPGRVATAGETALPQLRVGQPHIIGETPLVARGGPAGEVRLGEVKVGEVKVGEVKVGEPLGTSTDIHLNNTTAGGRVVEPARGPVIEPARGPVVEPARGRVVEPARGPVVEPARGRVVEPARGPVVEPARGRVVEPANAAAVDANGVRLVEPNGTVRFAEPNGTVRLGEPNGTIRLGESTGARVVEPTPRFGEKGIVTAEEFRPGALDTTRPGVVTERVGLTVERPGIIGEKPLVPEVGPRTKPFITEETFVNSRAQLAEDLRLRGVEPARIESLTKSLDDYARVPNETTFKALKHEWTQIEGTASKAGVPEPAVRQMQLSVERAIGTETPAGIRAVERPPVTATEAKVTTVTEGTAATQRPVVTERPVVNERPVVAETRPPAEQPKWEGTRSKITQQLDEVRTSVSESGAGVRTVDKLDEAITRYSKEPIKANLDELNKAFRELEQPASGAKLSAKASEQIAEVRQSLYQHMPPEHAAVARIEAATTVENASKAAKITDEIATRSQSMRNATTTDDFLRESRQLEKKVTNYLTEEVKTGRMTPQEALDVQRATRTVTQEAQQTLTTTLREQTALPKFKTEPVVGETKAPVAGETKAPVAGETKAPVAGETKAPVAGETKAPVAGETKAPVVAEAKAPLEATTLRSTTTADNAAAQIAARKQIAEEALGPRALEYQARVDAANASYRRMLNGSTEAAAEFRLNAGKANEIVKGSGAGKAVVEQLSIDVRASVQNARISTVATQLERATIANNDLISSAQRAIREANVPEPVRIKLEAQVHTYESHISGAASTNTQWGTNAGSKAITRQLAEMEKSFHEAGIDFRPFRRVEVTPQGNVVSGKTVEVERAVVNLRNAREAAAVGDRFFSPVREFTYNHPVLGKSLDFVWQNPWMLKAYIGLGALELGHVLRTGINTARDIEAAKVSTQEHSTQEHSTQEHSTQEHSTQEHSAQEHSTQEHSAQESGTRPGNTPAVTYTVRETGVQPDPARATTTEAQRISAPSAIPNDKTTVVPTGSSGTVDVRSGAGTEVRPAAATVVAPTDAVRPTAGTVDQPIVAGQRPDATVVRPTAERVADSSAQAVPNGTASTSHAFFSMPITPEDRRNENRRMNGGLNLDYVYFAKGPGSPAIVSDAQTPLASTNNTIFRVSSGEVAQERERPRVERFDWKLTRLDPSTLGRPDGFYMSNPYMGSDGRRVARSGGGSNQDKQGTGNNGTGNFARKYPFLANAAEAAKVGKSSPTTSATAEDSEALNPDSIGGSQATSPIMAYSANAMADPDQNMNTTGGAQAKQDEDQSALLT